MQKRFLGEYAEKMVMHYFENKGFELITSRFKKREGEIDLVIKNTEKIIFVEVKYRKVFEDFEGIVNDKKIERMYKTIEKFFIQFPNLQTLPSQIDLVFIDKNYNLTHVENI